MVEPLVGDRWKKVDFHSVSDGIENPGIKFVLGVRGFEMLTFVFHSLDSALPLRAFSLLTLCVYIFSFLFFAIVLGQGIKGRMMNIKKALLQQETTVASSSASCKKSRQQSNIIS